MFGFGYISSKRRVFNLAPPPPQALGIIYSGSDLSDWTQVGTSATFTQNGSDIICAGSGGTGGTGASNLFKDYILLNTTAHRFTCLPKWKITVDLTTGTINTASSFGIGLGVISTNGFEERDLICRVAMDNSVLGRAQAYYGDTDAIGINLQNVMGTTHSISSATRYKFQFEKDELTLYSRIYNSSDVLLYEETRTDSPPGGDVNDVHHNTGRFAINQFGGTTTIHNIEISSETQKYADSLFITDSIGYGGKASSLSNRWINLRQGDVFEVLGGWADRMQDAQTRINEVLALAPNHVYICLGSNDIKDGTWSGAGEAAFDSILSSLSGYTITNVSPTARNDVNVSAVETYMQGKGTTLLGYSNTKQASNSNLLGPLNSGDGIHLNDAGHAVLAAL